MSTDLHSYLGETARLTYWFWFKPITLNRHLKQVAGDIDIEAPLHQDTWQGFLGNAALLRSLGQLFTGALMCLFLGSLFGVWLPTILVSVAFKWRDVLFSVLCSVWFGVFFGFAAGVTISVLGGLAAGVTISVLGGLVFGVLQGVADSVLFSVWFGVVFSVAGGLAVGVMFGVLGGVAVDVSSGVAGGVLSGIIFGVLGGVAVSVLRSITVSVLRSVAGGVLSGIMFGVAFARLYAVPLWGAWSFLQWWRARLDKTYAKQAFRHSPIQYDELIYVPLLLFDHFLVHCIRADPTQRDNILTQVTNSTGQRWAARRAVIQLLFDNMLNIGNLNDMAALAQSIRSLRDTAVSQPRRQYLDLDQVRVLEYFEVIAEQLNVTTGQDSKYAVIQRLNQARQDLDDLMTATTMSRYTQFTQVAVAWKKLVDRTEAELTAQPNAERLPYVFSAGTPLDADAPSFRGRDDVFAMIQDVSSNPHRSEPLLLFGQPRMGKSSVLQQLPSKLASTLSLYVDCQTVLNVQSTSGYVAGLTKAIVDCDGVKRRRLSLQPLSLAQAQTEPLLQLRDWLENLAKAVPGRRVLLCLDEFEKIVAKVAEGSISPDVLDQIRGLSQRPGWLVLFSGTHELDELSAQFAEKFKNARRVKVSYLDEASTRELIERPEPDYPEWCEPTAVDKIIALTHCQPFLVQAMCASLVNYLNRQKRFVASAEDVISVLPTMFDEYRNYFISIRQTLTPEDYALLNAIAGGLTQPDTPHAIRRLIERDYIEGDGQGGFCFQVPLMQEWWKQTTHGHIP